MAHTKDIPVECQAHCAVAGDLLDTRVAEEKDLVAEYKGKKYYFCCPPCKPTFLANPEQYAGDSKKQITLSFASKEHITDNIWSFSFTPSELVEWTAGQYIRIDVPHDNADERGTKRWFTISSAPFEEIITITTRVSDSSFKQALTRLEAGMSIEMTDLPSGDFIWGDTDDTERIFVIGGIGITPFYSIAKQRKHDGLPLNATLLYANRTEDIPFRAFFDSLAGSGLSTQYLTGDELTIDTILDTATADTTQFYLSGAKPMIKGLADSLIQTGVSNEQIFSDEFVHYDKSNY